MAYRTILALSAATLLIAGPAFAQNRVPQRCTAGERTVPTLNKTALPGATFEMIEDVVSTQTDANGKETQVVFRHGLDKAHLADGVDLEVNQTGCNVHGNAYRFRIAKTERPASDAAYWLNKAVELIGLVEPANVDGSVNLPALKRILHDRAADPRAKAFSEGSIDGIIPHGGGEDRGRVTEAYLVVINQRAADRTTLSVSYIIGPL